MRFYSRPHSSSDAVVLEDLVRTYERPLRQFAFRLLGSQQAMEDVLQESFVKAFRALPSFRPRSEKALRAWLFRITYHACIDELRRSAREFPQADVDALGESGFSADPADRASEREILGSALASLPLDLRTAVLLVDLLGFDYRSAASLVDVPSGTLASRLNRARSLLRQAFDTPSSTLGGSR